MDKKCCCTVLYWAPIPCRTVPHVSSIVCDDDDDDDDDDDNDHNDDDDDDVFTLSHVFTEISPLVTIKL